MKKILGFLLALGLIYSASAQEVQITGVRAKEFKGVKAIVNKSTNQPEGYYTFYTAEKSKTEKVPKGQVLFNLELYHTDLSLIKKLPITISRYAEVTSSTFNGETFMFAFADRESNKIILMTIDGSGNLLAQKSIRASSLQTTEAEVFPAPGNGFYLSRPVEIAGEAERFGYTIERIDHALGALWTQQIIPPKGAVFIEAIESANDRLIVVQKHRDRNPDKVNLYLTCYKDQDGQTLYSQSLYNGIVMALPSAILIDKDNNAVLCGEYFEEQAVRSGSDGIFLMKLSPAGESLFFETRGWSEDSRKQLTVNTAPLLSLPDKKMSGMYVHEILESAGGGYKVISESYLLLEPQNTMHTSYPGGAFSATTPGGMAAGGTSEASIEIRDLLFFDFTKEGRLLKMTHVPKPHTSYILSTGSDMIRLLNRRIIDLPLYKFRMNWGNALLREVKEISGFDYSFYTGHPLSGESTFISKNLQEQARVDIHQSGSDHGISTRSVNLPGIPAIKPDSKPNVLPAVDGKMCFYLYNRETNTILLYLMNM